MSANPACLYAFSEHHNIWKPVLPDHPPEVRNSVRHGSWNGIQMEKSDDDEAVSTLWGAVCTKIQYICDVYK